MESSVVEKNTEEQRLRLLLPFYLNNTVAPAQRAEIDAWLATDAAARQELQFLRALTAAVRQPGSARAPLRGYEILAARLSAGRPALSWWRRLGTARWAPVTAMAALLLSVQLGWNYWRLPEPADGVVYRGVVARVARAADLKLVVRRDARFADLAELLARNGCHVVWGPSVSGELWVVLDEPATAEATRRQLARSPLIEDAMLLAAP